MTDDELLSRALSFDAGPPPTVNQFIVDDDDDSAIHRMTIESRGSTGWAICDGGGCVDRETGEIEYEPMPSSRGDNFIRRTRFDSPATAFAYLAPWKARKRAEADKRPGMIRWKGYRAG